jgi:integrase
MRKQTGYLFHVRREWYLRVYDTDRAGNRIQVCKKLPVEYGGEFKTKASVTPFVDEILAPLNSGILNPQSTISVIEFVETFYLPQFVQKKLRAATQKQYRDVWSNHLKSRMGKLTLRSFRTVDGETMLARIAEKTGLGRSSLRHCKAFLSGVFKQAKRLGILNGINPMQDTSVPLTEEPPETYAYSLPEISAMLAVLAEPTRTVVLTAAFTGLRKSELLGLRWQDFDGNHLSVNRSVWNGIENQPKRRSSRAPVPIVRQLAEALEAHRLRAGVLAQPGLPIFQGGTGQPLNLDNLVRRVITPAIEKCVKCYKSKSEHPTEGHLFELDESLCWHGWHAFRRGLATNLHEIGVDDRTIQAILRHSDIGITQKIYIKSVSKSQTTALDALCEKFDSLTDLCNVNATPAKEPVN